MKHLVDFILWVVCFVGLYWGLFPALGDQALRCTIAIMLCATLYAKLSIKIEQYFP